MDKTDVLSVGAILPLAGTDRLSPVLIELHGGVIGRSHPLRLGQNRLGRDSEHAVVLQIGRGISRTHATIDIRRGGKATLDDCNSTNGTWLNGQRIVGPTQLQSGDKIQIGTVLMRYGLQDPIDGNFHQTIFERSVLDPLTGIYNREYFLARLHEEMAFARRTDGPVALFVLDLDRFKELNDTFGHPAGDDALRQFSELVRYRIRTADVFARLGGDEFVLLMRLTGYDRARHFRERLYADVAATRFSFEGQTLPVGASIGIGVSHWDQPLDAETLYAVADKDLYREKDRRRAQ